MSIGGHELELYANNTSELHRMKMAIAKNLATKCARGTYRAELATRAWLPFVTAAAKRYVKEFGGGKWNELFTVADRQWAAAEFQAWWRAEHKLGHFEGLLPAKYQKRATRKASAAAFQKLGDKR